MLFRRGTLRHCMTHEPSPDSAADIKALVRETMAWGVFNSSLMHENRYVPRDDAYASRLLDQLLQAKTILPARSELFRARKLPAAREAALHSFRPEERGAPPPGKGSGRLNPDGLPCLYSAGDATTAIAEVRPWKRTIISVARFITERDVQIIDLAPIADDSYASACLRAFARAVSTPVHEGDTLSYVGTQYVAERLRHEGIEGVKYASALRHTGANFALFNPRDAVVKEVALHEVLPLTYASHMVSKASIDIARLFTPV